MGREIWFGDRRVNHNDYLEVEDTLFKSLVFQETKDELDYEEFEESLRSAKLVENAPYDPAYDMFYTDIRNTRVINPQIVYIHIDLPHENS